MDLLFLSKTVLFRGISPEEIKSMMGCLQAYTKNYTRGTIIHHAGDAVHSVQAAKHGSLEFEIPFNRQQLADYLSVDRSAMSNELSKMQRDGLLKVERSRFILQDTDSFTASP